MCSRLRATASSATYRAASPREETAINVATTAIAALATSLARLLTTKSEWVAKPKPVTPISAQLLGLTEAMTNQPSGTKDGTNA